METAKFRWKVEEMEGRKEEPSSIVMMRAPPPPSFFFFFFFFFLSSMIHLKIIYRFIKYFY
jgi:hypothetical protein